MDAGTGAPGSPFGTRLRQLRLAMGFSQEELAERAGLTPKGIGALERGERTRPYPSTLRAIGDALELSAKERSALFSLVAGPAPVSHPAPLFGSGAGSIPRLPVHMVGRELDAEMLDKLFSEDDARLVTLTGPGGVGKTSLAVDVAARVAARFADGAVFVDLAPVARADVMMTTIVQALGLLDGDIQLARDYLRDRQMLLVLDNLEHLLPAAPELAGLIADCPSIAILATSRAPLRIRGEREYAVPPLATPDSSHTPDASTISDSPAVRLFVERAKAIVPSFALTDRNAAAIAAICWKLDGLPLALELAAAQIRFLGPMELLARLDDGLYLDGARDLPRRQRTMRSTIDWSHGLLTPIEQRTFRRLSVFSGGFELDAAEAVCRGADISGRELVGAIGTLVEQSLLVMRGVGDDTTRYRMLEPTRQYAASKLEASGEKLELMDHFASFFFDLARQAMPALRGADQVRWLDRLARDYDNLRSAREWLLERGDRESAIRLVWALWSFWPIRGYASEIRRWLDRALSDLEELPPKTSAKGIWVSFGLALVCGDSDCAVALAETGLEIARGSSDPLDLAYGDFAHGIAALFTGDMAAARHRHAVARDRFRMLGDDWGTAAATVNLAQISLVEGNLDQAAELVNQSEVMVRAMGDGFTLMAVLSLQAAVASGRGRGDQAEAVLLEGLAIAARLQDVWSALLLITALAGVATRIGDLERAARLFGAAEAIRERTSVAVAWAMWRDQAERDVATVQSTLGLERFASLCAEGRLATLDDVIAGWHAERR